MYSGTLSLFPFNSQGWRPLKGSFSIYLPPSTPLHCLHCCLYSATGATNTTVAQNKQGSLLLCEQAVRTWKSIYCFINLMQCNDSWNYTLSELKYYRVHGSKPLWLNEFKHLLNTGLTSNTLKHELNTCLEVNTLIQPRSDLIHSIQVWLNKLNRRAPVTFNH